MKPVFHEDELKTHLDNQI